MAVNAYLYIDGIEGPSTSKAKCIDIISFSWGVSQTSTYGAGASGKEAKAGRADFSNLTIMKVLDKKGVSKHTHIEQMKKSDGTSLLVVDIDEK